MNMKRITALILSAVMALSLTACGGEEVPVETAAGVAVQVQAVETDTIATESKVTGRVSADDETMILVSSAVKCSAVYANAGDQVEAGDVIC